MIIKKIMLCALIGWLSLIGLTHPAEAKVYIDIDTPGFQQFPIAVKDFQVKGAPAGPTADLAAAITEQVRIYLGMTGLFHALDKRSFLDGVEPGTQAIRFEDWAVIGADFLLVGDLAAGEKETLITCQLYDVMRGQLIVQKKYSGRAGQAQAIARSIVSDILLALTGDEGDLQTRIAFVLKKGAFSDIYTINYDGTGLKKLTSHQSIVSSPRWSPDGRYLAFTSYSSGRPAVYLSAIKTGEERKVAAFGGLNLCGGFSPDSRKLLLTLSKDGNEEIYALDISTLSLTRLTRNFAIDVSPAWSPDGKKIVFVSDRSGSPQVFMMDADGGNVERVTYEGNYNTSPSWSPSGRRIAYEGLIDHKFQIFSVDEKGDNLIQLTFDDTNSEYPSWSPSGRQIVFCSKLKNRHRLSIMNANGLNVRILMETPEQLVMPAWSPRAK